MRQVISGFPPIIVLEIVIDLIVVWLQRNLKIMVNMGLSAKQEKDNRVQHIKREVAEMIKLRIPVMKSKVCLCNIMLVFFSTRSACCLC